MDEISEPPARLTVDELFSLFAAAECKFFPLSATIICSLSLNGMRARERELQRMFIKIVECLLEHLLRRLHSLTSTIRGEDLVHVKVVDNVMSSLAFSFAVRERCARWFDEGQSSERVCGFLLDSFRAFELKQKKASNVLKIDSLHSPISHTHKFSFLRASCCCSEWIFCHAKIVFFLTSLQLHIKVEVQRYHHSRENEWKLFSSLIYDLAALFKLDETLCSSRHILADEKRCWSLSNIKRKKEARESLKEKLHCEFHLSMTREFSHKVTSETTTTTTLVKIKRLWNSFFSSWLKM